MKKYYFDEDGSVDNIEDDKIILTKDNIRNVLSQLSVYSEIQKITNDQVEFKVFPEYGTSMYLASASSEMFKLDSLAHSRETRGNSIIYKIKFGKTVTL